MIYFVQPVVKKLLFVLCGTWESNKLPLENPKKNL